MASKMEVPQITKHAWRDCLTKKCETLVNDLQVEDCYLVYSCFAKGIINDRQKADIMHPTRTHYDKAGCFFDILLRIDNQHYFLFLELLFKQQPELAIELADCLGVTEQLTAKKPEQNEIVPRIANDSQKKDQLVKILINLQTWQDAECNGFRAMELLQTTNIMEPIRKPSLFLRMIRKAEQLVESGIYVSILQTMVPQYKEYQHQLDEDPMLWLVEELERRMPSALIDNHENLLDLIKVLLKLDSSTNTWSRCMHILMSRTKEYRMSVGEEFPDTTAMKQQLQWDDKFIEVMKILLDKGADPSWTSELGRESNLHIFLRVVHQVVVCKSHLFNKLLDLLGTLMTDAATSCSNLDSDGQNVLHALVDSNMKYLRADKAEYLLEIAVRIKMKNPALLNQTDAFKNSPLQSFVFGIHEQDRYDINSDTVKFINVIVPALKSETSVNLSDEKGSPVLHKVVLLINHHKDEIEVREELFQLMQKLKSNSNMAAVDRHGWTVLHILAVNADDWAKSADFFLRLIENLASCDNINIKDRSGRTALFKFTSMANHWNEQGSAFLEVLKYLVSSSNIDYRDENGQTPLHLFVSMEAYWKDQARIFFEIVKLLRSSSNIDFKDHRLDSSPLHMFIAAQGNWSLNEETFLEVIKCLRSTLNIDYIDCFQQSPLHLFISMGNYSNKQAHVFLEVVKCLCSPTNIDYRFQAKQTSLILFISMAMFWKNEKHVFLEIVKCLRSKLNVSYRNLSGHTGQTALDLFQTMKIYQEETLDTDKHIVQEVIKQLS